MTAAPSWWSKPRRIRVVVDNPSWVLPFAEDLKRRLTAGGDRVELQRDYLAVEASDVTFMLGCVRLAPAEFLARSRMNLVVHASDLPKGRGFSPLTWYILEGRSRIPVCLLEAAETADSGPVLLRDGIVFEGHELVDEMRAILGAKSIELCERFLAADRPLEGVEQDGEPSYFARRRPEDSRLDPDAPLKQQFELLRVVDNDRYPAFFEMRGCKYVLRIEKASG